MGDCSGHIILDEQLLYYSGVRLVEASVWCLLPRNLSGARLFLFLSFDRSAFDRSLVNFFLVDPLAVDSCSFSVRFDRRSSIDPFFFLLLV